MSIHLELNPDVEKRVTAQAEACSQSPAVLLETLVEQHFAQEADLQPTLPEEKDKSTHTPIELCFSLWVKGFVNSSLSISIILSLLSMLGIIIIILVMGEPFKLDTGRPTSPQEKFLINFATLQMVIGNVSYISTFTLAFLASLRFVFIRYSIMGLIPTLIGVIAYFVIFAAIISFVEKQDQSYQYGVISAFIVTIIAAIIGVAGLRYKGPEENEKSKSKFLDKLKVILRKFFSWQWARNLDKDLRKFFSGQWTRNLDEEVGKIHSRNKGVEEENKKFLSISDCIPRADITGDFKAWNDATKLLLTIATGLTVVAALFSNGNNQLEQTIRIIAFLFLLVPGLSCAHMEAFKRQCERQWLIVDEKSKTAEPETD